MVSAKQLVGGITMYYVIGIVLIFGTGILALVLSEAFGEFRSPFVMTYNGIRNLVLFFLIFPIALPLILGAFVGDLILTFAIPFINSMFRIGFPTSIGGKSLIQIVGDKDSGMLGQLIGLTNSLFPPLPEF